MKKLFATITTFALAISFSGCSSTPTTNPDGINIPQEKDANAEQKVEIHNKIAKGTYEIGDKIRTIINQIKLYNTEDQEEKPTPADLQKTYDEIFNKSEEIRKLVTEDFKGQTEIHDSFENTYLPKLDIMLVDLKDLIANPSAKENYDKTSKTFDEYYKAHNEFTEILNKNIFY